MNYIFKTTATMKEYNNKKWYIDGGIVSDMRIDADSVENALEIYRERVEKKHCITISKNAIKNNRPGIAPRRRSLIQFQYFNQDLHRQQKQ
jgi:hypothetical protein